MTELITLNLQNYYCSAAMIQCICKLLQEKTEAETNLLRGFFLCSKLNKAFSNWAKFTTARRAVIFLLKQDLHPASTGFQRKLWDRYFILIITYLAYSSLFALDTEAASTLLKQLFHGLHYLCHSPKDTEWNHPLLSLGWATNIWTEPCEKSDVIHQF